MNTPGKSTALLLCLFIFIAGHSQQDEASRKDFATVHFEQKVQKWKEAYNSKDARQLIELYAPDARYISGHVVGLELIGRDKVIAYFQAGIELGGHVDSIEILQTSISADLASVLTKYKANNAGQIAIGRNLLVLKKISGAWMIILHMTVV